MTPNLACRREVASILVLFVGFMMSFVVHVQA